MKDSNKELVSIMIGKEVPIEFKGKKIVSNSYTSITLDSKCLIEFENENSYSYIIYL